MIKVVGRHVVIDVRCTSIEKVTTQDFNESSDEVCNALRKTLKILSISQIISHIHILMKVIVLQFAKDNYMR